MKEGEGSKRDICLLPPPPPCALLLSPAIVVQWDYMDPTWDSYPRWNGAVCIKEAGDVCFPAVLVCMLFSTRLIPAPCLHTQKATTPTLRGIKIKFCGFVTFKWSSTALCSLGLWESLPWVSTNLYLGCLIFHSYVTSIWICSIFSSLAKHGLHFVPFNIF